MPLYEYRCKDCGSEFEKMIRFTEANQLPACPKCESLNTQKKLSHVSSFGASSSGVISTSSSCGSSGGFG